MLLVLRAMAGIGITLFDDASEYLSIAPEINRHFPDDGGDPPANTIPRDSCVILPLGF